MGKSIGMNENEEREMYSLFKLVVVVLLVFCFAVPAVAGWRVYKSASIQSKEKSTLRFEKYSEGPIRACFILNRKRKGAFASKLPLYKVDNDSVCDLEGKKNSKVKEGRWIRWEIDDGKGLPDVALLEFMNGKSVVFQYYMPDGRIMEETFSLEGAREAIEELLK